MGWGETTEAAGPRAPPHVDEVGEVGAVGADYDVRPVGRRPRAYNHCETPWASVCTSGCVLLVT